MKAKIKKVIRKTKNTFSKKVPVSYPLLYGQLLIGRTAFITGGNSGIGYQIAETFVRNGASVIITGRNKEKTETAAKKLQKLIEPSSEQFVDHILIDINNIKTTIKNIDDFLNSHKYEVDILVNNAGTGIGDTIGKTSVEDYETVLKTNLEGTYFISQLFHKHMTSHKLRGNILNILSTSSFRPAVSAYSCSKWGERGLTIGMAKKYIQDDIVVNGIAPGPTATKMLKIDPQKDGITLPGNPSGRYAMPEEIANLAAVLVSDLGRMVVGDVLMVTGGAATITVDDIDY